MARKEVDPPEQSRFEFGRNGVVRFSGDVSTLEFGQIATKFLIERAIWKDIPKEGDFLLIEADEEEINWTVDREKWLKVKSINLEEGDEKKDFAAALVIFPSNVNGVSNGYCVDLFGKAVSYLNENAGGFFVIEKTGPDQGINWRKDVLKKVGLVDIQIFTSQRNNGYLVWAGRLKKEPIEREPVNIIDRNNPHKYYWRARRLWWRMITYYRKQGYGMYKQEESELFKRLSASKHPYFDLNLVGLMVGVDLVSSCGCKWRVPIKASLSWERTSHCPDEGCDGIPAIPEKYAKEELFFLNREIPTNIGCYDCSEGETKMVRSYRRVIKDKKERPLKLKPGIALLLEETSCPHCGNPRHRELKVNIDQLRN